jgi:predicted RNA binding protein YcfA (HicA-like mRNA interferase family)
VKLPRDVSGSQLAQALRRLGYEMDHQTGSHLRLTTRLGGEHHLTIPAHDPLKVGTLSAILKAAGEHSGLSPEELLRRLFG